MFTGKDLARGEDIWRRVAVDPEQWRILSKDAVSGLLAKSALVLNKKRGGGDAHCLALTSRTQKIEDDYPSPVDKAFIIHQAELCRELIKNLTS